MLKTRFVVVAVAALAAVSCSKQVAPVQPTPAQAQGALSLPFEVPEGAQFVVRTRGATTLYRIRETCRPLQAMNPSNVVFFWTLEAGERAGYQLSKEEGCS